MKQTSTNGTVCSVQGPLRDGRQSNVSLAFRTVGLRSATDPTPADSERASTAVVAADPTV